MAERYGPAWLGSLLGQQAVRVEGIWVKVPCGSHPARVLLGHVCEWHLYQRASRDDVAAHSIVL
jgi:hypothetical protein